MSLFLVQHGKHLPKETDSEQGLSPEGKEEVGRIAGFAREHGVTVSAIRHSGKKRARETAEIFAQALNAHEPPEEMEGLAPLDDVTRLTLTSGEDLMLVGHLPFLEKLTSHLITGSSDRPPVLRFQNGGVVCLDRDPVTESWYIKWTLFPRVY